ncbi:3-hydroxyisobutyrate dehydrogenase [Phytophthora citrophthora]|uniref:3-hydroxyisobutyrate dehydrogenase n=1 Tax=Phytophthora citrophthora TaxID=4793 RepID=A0AAD9LC82_9STRA|nr:3-hydroxyisobutyrate dehydrogenase [Phytophthora citrophthora]
MFLQQRSYISTTSSQHVGIIGLGQMGGRMADNLRKKGHNLVVCDPVPDNVQKQVDQGGAVAASTPKEVAEQCDTIITMLPSTAIVENVYLGDNGVHEALRSEHLLLDSSTIDPIFTKKLSKELHDRGATFVDAPVSGGVAGAQNGTLTFMVGGEAEEFERVKPLLKAMGKNLVHCGGSCMYMRMDA